MKRFALQQLNCFSGAAANQQVSKGSQTMSAFFGMNKGQKPQFNVDSDPSYSYERKYPSRAQRLMNRDVDSKKRVPLRECSMWIFSTLVRSMIFPARNLHFKPGQPRLITELSGHFVERGGEFHHKNIRKSHSQTIHGGKQQIQ